MNSDASIGQDDIVARLPIEAMPLGELLSISDPNHESWHVLGDWLTPLCPRGGFKKKAYLTRGEHGGKPCVEWARGPSTDQAFVIGDPGWRDYALSCMVQPLQAASGVTNDEQTRNARAGLVFRMETARRYYTFCVENQRRLVLFRRIDDEWHELASRAVDAFDETLTLEVFLDGDGIRARCPDRGVELTATDATIRTGRGGFRAQGACRLFALAMAMTPGQRRRAEADAAAQRARLLARRGDTPDAVQVAEWRLGADSMIVACADFCRSGRNDLLLHTPDGLIARTWEGQELWRLPGATRFVEISPPLASGGRRLYALAGARQDEPRETVRGFALPSPVADELLAVDGVTGAVLARTRLPSGAFENDLRYLDLGVGTGRLFGDEPLDVVVRTWRKSLWGAGRELWAYDRDLTLRWEREVNPPYGHHNALHFFDVDSDGRDELLAGGVLFGPDGATRWVHDRADEMLGYVYAVHYDAAQIGRFAEDPEADARAFLAGGSAGLYVVDARTGRTVAVHRIGHAQWCLSCRLRADLPGRQVLAGTRWGNYGIITLLSGRGERLWTIQPDFIGQGSVAVRWAPGDVQHLWHNTSAGAMGLYDGHGQLVNPLDPLRRLSAGRFGVEAQALARQPGGPDALVLHIGDVWHVFAPQV
jgi:hypothetical protein